MQVIEPKSYFRAAQACSGEEMVMGSQPPLANTVTLGVQDFSRERDFYQRLGWPVVFESDGFTLFQLRGAVLALFQLGQLARDAHAPAGPISAGIRSAVIFTVDRPGEVDELARRARAAGGTLTKEPPMPSSSRAATPTSPIPKATTGKS